MNIDQIIPLPPRTRAQNVRILTDYGHCPNSPHPASRGSYARLALCNLPSGYLDGLVDGLLWQVLQDQQMSQARSAAVQVGEAL